LTFDSKSNGNPVLSPDGRLAFFSARGFAQPSLYTKDLSDTGGGESSLPPGFQTPDDWSLDGKFIVYTQREDRDAYDLWILPLSGDRKPILFLGTPFNEENARFSPDGKWIAYVSDASGRREVYVKNVADKRQTLISTAGGTRPQWTRDGKELFYLGLDNQIMALHVKPGTTAFDADVPVPLFRIAAAGWTGGGEDSNAYNVTPDGQRFLVQVNTEGSQSATVAVIVNWAADRKQ
jgi:Tol biopolymer transport system component